MTDFYDTLGLEKDATEQDIKLANKYQTFMTKKGVTEGKLAGQITEKTTKRSTKLTKKSEIAKGKLEASSTELKNLESYRERMVGKNPNDPGLIDLNKQRGRSDGKTT